MKQQGNFLLLEQAEFKDWLSKQSVTRSIKTLQVHHTALPNYTTRKFVNGKAQQDHFVCLEGMRTSHLKEGWAATGQNITIFEDGKIAISLDRHLNRIPAGIRLANAGAICIEIIGGFDKGGDTMTVVQKKSVVHVYACLAERFNIPITTDGIVYHAWFTYGGDRLSDYTPGKSSKSCPGTAFWGLGNTVASAKKGFMVDVKVEYELIKKGKVIETIMKNFSKYFGDVQKEWMASAIDKGKERGLFAVPTDKKFRPDDPISRGEFAVVMERLVDDIVKGKLK